jgi:hypothetical protein
MRMKAILVGVVLLVAVQVVVDQRAPEWRNEARNVLRSLAQVLR